MKNKANIFLSVLAVSVVYVGVYAFGLGVLAALPLMFVVGAVVGQLGQDNTPSDHLKRNVGLQLVRRRPARTPLDTLIRRMGLDSPGKQEKEEWEEEADLPRKSAASGAVTGGANTDTLNVTAGHGSYFRVDDLVYVPSVSDVLRVTAISTDALTVQALGGGNVPAIANAAQVIRAANAKVEGFDASDPRSNDTEQKFNYHMDFDAVIEITNRRAATWNHTNIHDWRRMRDNQIEQFRRDMNNASWVSKKSKESLSGKNLTTMDGVIVQVPNTTSYTAATFDESDLIDITRQVFTGNGGGGSPTRFWFVPSLVAQDLANIPLDKVRRDQVESKSLEMMLERFRTPFGSVVVVYDPSLDELGITGKSYILDLAYIKRKVLRPMEAIRLLKEETGTDIKAIQLKETFTTFVQYQDAHLEVTRS